MLAMRRQARINPRGLPTVVILVAVVAVSFYSLSGATAGHRHEPGLAERIQKIEDEKAIRDLLMEYGRLLDTRDLAGFSRLFSRQGEWAGLLGGKPAMVRGPEAIRSAVEQAFADRPYNPEQVNSFHVVTNITIQVNGDHATGYSRWMTVYRDEEDRPVTRLGGHYDDVYIREDGDWKFLRRTATREIP